MVIVNQTETETETSTFLGFTGIKNHFIIYFSILFLEAYFLALLVSYLNKRTNAVVFPLNAPESGTKFTEYIILIKTSIRLGSSLDSRARVRIQLIGSFHDSAKLLLQRGKNIDFFLCRGGTNIFVYHSPTDLGDIREIVIELFNDIPYEIPYVQWKPSYISVNQPVSKMFWGCPINFLMKTEDNISQSFNCFAKKKDHYGIVKSINLFHMWLSVFHCPTRLGMYSTLVNVIVVFFMLASLLFGLYYVHKTYEKINIVTSAITIGIVWIVELILEAFLRNTVSSVRVSKLSLYNGLVEPYDSELDFDTISMDYDWDAVRPLVNRSKVRLVWGTKHPGAYSIFQVPRPHTVINLWGMLTEEEQKETRYVTRFLNECALPLPATLNWLSLEAFGRKEEILIHCVGSKFTAPHCVFDTWLIDWPLTEDEDPMVAGLIISHIMCSDLLMLINIKHLRKRAHYAQLCVHQWHGLICCLYLYIILHEREERKVAVSKLKYFMTHTLNQFGKRSPRQIKSVWIKRNTAKEAYLSRKSVVPVAMDHVRSEFYTADLNTSSKNDHTNSEYYFQPEIVQDRLIFETQEDVARKTQKRLPAKNLQMADPNDLNYNAEYVEVGLADNVDMESEIKTKERTRDQSYEPRLIMRKNVETTKNYNTNAATDEKEVEDELDKLRDEDVTENEKKEHEIAMTETRPMALYERQHLGPPFRAIFAPKYHKQNLYLRYNNELLAYCCQKKRCTLFRHIHRKVGVGSLEVLNNVIQKFVDFVMIPPLEITGANILKRKALVFEMIKGLKKKANLYSDDDFSLGQQPIHDGFNTNALLTSVYSNIRQFVDIVATTRLAKKEKVDSRLNTVCKICVKPLNKSVVGKEIRCHDVDRIAKFLSKGCVYAAEKEMTSQFESRYTIQNFCAHVVYQARLDVTAEFEDPPAVMAAHVLQATLHLMLSEQLPKQTDFYDMSADELRKIGTRLQRIKARYANKCVEKNRTKDEKSKIEKIQYLLNELTTRWQLSSQTKTQMFTAHLLAQCLVHERIMGLSVYSGFIGQEHVLLFNGDKEKLTSIESKATSAVIKIARLMCRPIVEQALGFNEDIDVIFTDMTKEYNYTTEKVVLSQYRAEPSFLATVTFYIADIVALKMNELRKMAKYMNDLKGVHGLQNNPFPKAETKFKFSGNITIATDYTHEEVCSPMLRWGDIVIKGEPPLDPESIHPRIVKNPAGEGLAETLEKMSSKKDDGKILAALIGVKKGVDNFARAEEYDKEKQLQQHLARVQSQLMDQLADATQAISQTTPLDKDYVSEFHQDDLFNVELYASHKLGLPIATVFGIIILIFLVVLTILAIAVICIEGSKLEIAQIKECALMWGIGFLAYGFLLQPIKCILYSLTNIYVD